MTNNESMMRLYLNNPITDLLIREYIDKCKLTGCDGCIAEYHCIENCLKIGRYPDDSCSEKLKSYLETRFSNKEP